MLGVQVFPLCPAPSIATAGGISVRTCLTPPQAGEFPRAPPHGATRRNKRDTGGFFWFVFFPGKENEQA